MKTVSYGNLPVPVAVMWSGEDKYYVGTCPTFGVKAVCQHEAQGEGVPRFGQPHTLRQRKVLAHGLCDICAKPLRHRTKYTMSNVGNDVSEVATLTQSEPLLCLECAELSMLHCPSLKRQLEAGRLRVRKVLTYSARPTPITFEERQRFVPNSNEQLIGLAVLDITKWKDVTTDFLKRFET